MTTPSGTPSEHARPSSESSPSTREPAERETTAQDAPSHSDSSHNDASGSAAESTPAVNDAASDQSESEAPKPAADESAGPDPEQTDEPSALRSHTSVYTHVPNPKPIKVKSEAATNRPPDSSTAAPANEARADEQDGEREAGTASAAQDDTAQDDTTQPAIDGETPPESERAAEHAATEEHAGSPDEKSDAGPAGGSDTDAYIQEQAHRFSKTPTLGDASEEGVRYSDESRSPKVPRAVVPRPVPDGASIDHPSLYFNRELSWLDFNWRVLYQAQDERTPLLERLRFLSITASNLDDFVRKRVGGLKRQHAAGVAALSPDGRSPHTQLQLLAEAIQPMYSALDETWTELTSTLHDRIGLHILDYHELTEAQKQTMYAYFETHIFPILTPLAVDPGRPFPFISNMSLSLAVLLRHPTRGTDHFARVKVPTTRSRWLPVGDALHFVPIEQVIAHNIHKLFQGMELRGVYAFRVTRNADVRRDEEEADDLTVMISESLRERRFAPVVRLEVERSMPESTRQFLARELSLNHEDVYVAEHLIDYTDAMALADVHVPDSHYSPELRYTPWEPVVPSRLRPDSETKTRRSIFSTIRDGDLIVHHPYDSFQASVQRFIEEAATDPKVMAIKQTLYRTSANSPIVEALVKAAEHGKQVAVLVEVKARFDEERNIEWGQKLEDAGVHVAYGLVGLKTHAKATLVVREEDGGPRTYCHMGTGNYNSTTARLYTDLGLMTCDPDIGYDITNLFHYLTGYAPDQQYRRLLVAPRNMREAFIDLVRQEVKHQREGGNGHIVAKMNALGDIPLIHELYRASQEGVQVDLIVRGHCRLRPGVPGYSENIRVISIVGRFLEHERLYYFRNGGDPNVLLGSADWQRNKLEDRVEAIVPIDDDAIKKRLIRILMSALADRRLAWDLRHDGHYIQRHPQNEMEEVGFQDILMQRALERTSAARSPWNID